MNIFADIAERRIREAIENGDFDDLPGTGKPLRLDDDTWIPEDLRIAYRVLKNAGCVPPELEIRKEVITLGELLSSVDDDKERVKIVRRLNFTLMKLAEARKRPLLAVTDQRYETGILEKITKKQLSPSPASP